MSQRLGAGSYMLWASLAVLVWSASTFVVCKVLADKARVTVEELDFLMSGLGIVLGGFFYGLSARRLKDLNMPPWLVKLLAFPLLALILMPYLCLVSGPQAENQYGPAPRSSSFGKVFSAVVALFLALNMSFSALSVYYKSKHALTISAGAMSGSYSLMRRAPFALSSMLPSGNERVARVVTRIASALPQVPCLQALATRCVFC